MYLSNDRLFKKCILILKLQNLSTAPRMKHSDILFGIIYIDSEASPINKSRIIFFIYKIFFFFIFFKYRYERDMTQDCGSTDMHYRSIHKS